MLQTDFKSKLGKLNWRIRLIPGKNGVGGIYVKDGRPGCDESSLYSHVCNMFAAPWSSTVPKFDFYDGEQWHRGWKGALRILWRRKMAAKDEISKLFGDTVWMGGTGERMRVETQRKLTPAERVNQVFAERNIKAFAKDKVRA